MEAWKGLLRRKTGLSQSDPFLIHCLGSPSHRFFYRTCGKRDTGRSWKRHEVREIVNGHLHLLGMRTPKEQSEALRQGAWRENISGVDSQGEGGIGREIGPEIWTGDVEYPIPGVQNLDCGRGIFKGTGEGRGKLWVSPPGCKKPDSSWAFEMILAILEDPAPSGEAAHPAGHRRSQAPGPAGPGAFPGGL